MPKINKKIALYTLVITGLAILVIGKISYSHQRCQNRKIQVIPYQGQKYLTEREALYYINKKLGVSIIGSKCNEINLDSIEEAIKRLPQVRDAQVFKEGVGNTININIYLRKPLAKIYTGKQSYVIDPQGYMFPVRAGASPYVIPITGELDIKIKKPITSTTNIKQLVDTTKSLTYQAFLLTKYIHKNKFFDDLITQIYLKDGQIYLVPRVGRFTIIFGDISNYEKKFRNLEAFLKNLNKIGWNKYSIINVSYNNQIVCTKRY